MAQWDVRGRRKVKEFSPLLLYLHNEHSVSCYHPRQISYRWRQVCETFRTGESGETDSRLTVARAWGRGWGTTAEWRFLWGRLKMFWNQVKA